MSVVDYSRDVHEMKDCVEQVLRNRGTGISEESMTIRRFFKREVQFENQRINGDDLVDHFLTADEGILYFQFENVPRTL